MLPPIAPAIRASSVLSRSSANRHPAISRSIQAFASRAIGTSPSHRDANGRGASLFDTIDCYLRREQTMWVIASATLPVHRPVVVAVKLDDRAPGVLEVDQPAHRIRRPVGPDAGALPAAVID